MLIGETVILKKSKRVEKITLFFNKSILQRKLSLIKINHTPFFYKYISNHAHKGFYFKKIKHKKALKKKNKHIIKGFDRLVLKFKS